MMIDKYIVVSKDGHKYIFRYHHGDEPMLLRRVMEYAKDPSCNLDWLDFVRVFKRVRDIWLDDMKNKEISKIGDE